MNLYFVCDQRSIETNETGERIHSTFTLYMEQAHGIQSLQSSGHAGVTSLTQLVYVAPLLTFYSSLASY